MQKDIADIAGVHLGKAGDGTAVKPYVTPEKVDPSLLVAVPRILNRTRYGIPEEGFFTGADVWNAYEFSTLLPNGFPVSGLLKLVYNSETPNIVESKSLKLYLNSYNLDITMPDMKSGSFYDLENRISNDVSKCVGQRVLVKLVTPISSFRKIELVSPFTCSDKFSLLERMCFPQIVSEMVFTHENNAPELLKTVAKQPLNVDYLTSHSLRSNCRVTNQPDWGDVFIIIKGSVSLTPQSLLQYIISMRKENHFHEEICEMIYKSIWDLISKDNEPELLVACLYTRRGGIDINPVRASSKKFLEKNVLMIDHTVLCEKTLRQ